MHPHFLGMRSAWGCGRGSRQWAMLQFNLLIRLRLDCFVHWFKPHFTSHFLLRWRLLFVLFHHWWVQRFVFLLDSALKVFIVALLARNPSLLILGFTMCILLLQGYAFSWISNSLFIRNHSSIIYTIVCILFILGLKISFSLYCIMHELPILAL